MAEGIKNINQKISFFKRKYYLNLLTRGAILAPALILCYFLFASVLEHNLWLGKSGRFFLLIAFVAVVVFCALYFFRKPIQWWIYKKGLDEEQSARIIGSHFPSVADRLLNIIQLSSSAKKNPLLEASIEQKSGALQNVSFETAVDISRNRKYLRYLLIPVGVILVLSFVNSNIFTQSTGRIVHFNQEFSPQAPFQFAIGNEKLVAFFNEDFTLDVSLLGSAIPESAYIISDNQRWKMEGLRPGKFQYTFEKLQHQVNFQIEASGFFSSSYQLVLANRPEVSQIKIALSYPGYLGKHTEEITNAGNIEIPEGTRVTWKIRADHAKQAQIDFGDASNPQPMQVIDEGQFSFGKNFRDNDVYSISLENESSKNKDRISYSIDVLKDQYPQIFLENLRDSILYKSILLGGHLKDDYGITDLKLTYQINVDDPQSKKHSVKIPITVGAAQVNFFHNWSVDSLHLKPGDKLSYFLEVWDNDGVNGRKSTRSASYVFSLPSEEDLKTSISNQQNATESKFDKSVQKAKEIKESINEAQQKLRGKQSLDWQDKKMLEDLLNQKNKLDKSVEELKKENQLLEQKKETFTEENQRIKEKSEQIQKLMNELLDEETKKLFNELEKLLKENTDVQQMQRLLEKMDRKEINLEKELERTLELFKELQYEYKLDQAINNLQKQAEKQADILNNTKELAGEKADRKDQQNQNNADEKKDDKGKDSVNDKKDEGKEGVNEKKDDKGKDNANDRKDDQNKSDQQKSSDDLSKEQQELQEDLKNFEKEMEELRKLGDEMKKDDDSPSQEDFNQLENSEQQSKDQLQQNNPKKSIEPQKKSLDQMKKMQKQMQQAQAGMEMEIDQQNLESLRQIVHGLIKLSYDQENLMKEFNGIQQSDPKYVQLSQAQINLQNDSKVLEDSLLALGKKDPFMGNIVTREIGELNDHMNKAVSNIKERHKGNASAEMQFSMSKINNLALLLDDHFESMMSMMAKAASGGKGKPKKGQEQKPGLGKMQQELNDQIQQLKNGQKTGKQFSQELARLAAEQERIRRALQEMSEKMKKEGGSGLGGDMPAKMEQTEMDLVNKNITEETIRRQSEILTRLLEAEKSMRERDQDNERKGETAKDHKSEMPPAFEEYLRLKEKEVELLKTLPPRLFPYYKKEVTEYFKRIN
jgi:multisubunit Na+/H+ antiporter MnhB subunit